MISPRLLVALIIFVYALYIVYYLGRARWDATSFIVAGDRRVNETAVIAPIRIIPNSVGYDGQFYYRLALNPFDLERTAYGITIYDPAIRMQRIGYPLLAWILSFGGRPPLVPWMLIALNLVGIGIIAGASLSITSRSAAPLWWGILPSLYPGFLLTIRRDTTEIVATAFAVLALNFALKRSFWKAAPFAAAAVLTRETTLLYLLGFGAVEIWNMIKAQRWSWDILPIASPLAVYCSWQYTLYLRLGVLPLSSGSADNMGLPLVGISRFLRTNFVGHDLAPYMLGVLAAAAVGVAFWALGRVTFKWRGPAIIVAWCIYAIILQTVLRTIKFDSALHGYNITAGLFCAVVVGLVGWAAYRGRPPATLVVTWLSCVILFLFVLESWSEPYSFMRAFTECYVTGTILLILAAHRIGYTYAAVVALMQPPTLWYSAIAGP